MNPDHNHHLPHPLVFPKLHYPKRAALSEIVAAIIGSSFDPDHYLTSEAIPTDQDRARRDDTVQSILDGSIN